MTVGTGVAVVRGVGCVGVPPHPTRIAPASRMMGFMALLLD
jgi:hypothetical protein